MWKTVAQQLVENVAEILRAIRNALNWRIVRGVGQLQILTRASYALLVLVPICASTWPAVRLVVNQHNKAAREAVEHLRATRSDVERALEDAQRQLVQTPSTSERTAADQRQASNLIARLIDSVQTIGNAAEKYTTDYAEHTIKTPRLPWSLGAAFFAALFVVVGHFVYQIAAPEPIRQTSWDEFILNRKDDYAKHPSDAALDRANQFLRSPIGRRIEASERFEDERLLTDLYFLSPENRPTRLGELSPGRLRSLVGWIQSGESHAPADYQREILAAARDLLPTSSESKHSEMTIIEKAARAEYLHLAGKRPVAIMSTGALYAIGVWLILVLLKTQATAVVTAADWHSLRDLFFH
jgi:hypothetical protein